jgi:hypothetical protein
MNSIQYHHYEKDMEFLPLSKYSREFEVLDCEPCEKKKFHGIKSTLNKLVNKLYMYTVVRQGEWENLVVKAALGELACGVMVEGFDLRELNHSEWLTDVKNLQDMILVRRCRNRAGRKRVFKLKKLEDEGVMNEEAESKAKGKKKTQKISGEDY